MSRVKNGTAATSIALLIEGMHITRQSLIFPKVIARCNYVEIVSLVPLL